MHKLLQIVLASLLVFVSCQNSQKEKATSYDFPQILEKDTLRVITLNTSTSYFIYRDQEMGYHYDMIKNFSKEQGFELQILVAQNPNMLLEMLYTGEGDVIAYNVPIENSLKDSLLYCGLTEISHQVLVQRSTRQDTLLTDVTQLIGKDVYVVKDTKFHQRMLNLNAELGGGIEVKNVDKDTVVTEDLIRMVSSGEIPFTVADENLAKLNYTYFRNIDVHLPVSFDQRTSWAVRKDMPILADSLNKWFARSNRETNSLRIIKRYFEETKGFSEEDRPSYVEILGPGQISPFDSYFKQYGKELGVDWRLLASVAYHESSFNTEGESWAGAIGLMGLMPATAATMGVSRDELYQPEINIKTGSRYLKTLIDAFTSIDDHTERIKMALASYNGGIGHVSDARALAEKYDADKNIWEGNVEKYIQLKRLEQYYKDPVCRAGYFRGDETVNYVRNVMERWNVYSEKVK